MPLYAFASAAAARSVEALDRRKRLRGARQLVPQRLELTEVGRCLIDVSGMASKHQPQRIRGLCTISVDKAVDNTLRRPAGRGLRADDRELSALGCDDKARAADGRSDQPGQRHTVRLK